MCKARNCERENRCYRKTAKPNPHGQEYMPYSEGLTHLFCGAFRADYRGMSLDEAKKFNMEMR